MAELGPTAPELHQEIGEYARGRCDVLFAIGDLASEAAAAFGAEGQPVADIDAARAALDPLLASGVTVLVKGSRVMGLDRLVRTLELEAAEGELDADLPHRVSDAALLGLQRLQLPDDARDLGRADGARACRSRSART